MFTTKIIRKLSSILSFNYYESLARVFGSESAKAEMEAGCNSKAESVTLTPATIRAAYIKGASGENIKRKKLREYVYEFSGSHLNMKSNSKKKISIDLSRVTIRDRSNKKYGELSLEITTEHADIIGKKTRNTMSHVYTIKLVFPSVEAKTIWKAQLEEKCFTAFLNLLSVVDKETD